MKHEKSHFIARRGEWLGSVWYIENNTWACGDREFLFECSTWYLTGEPKHLTKKMKGTYFTFQKENVLQLFFHDTK